jgi:hypothetical protein
LSPDHDGIVLRNQHHPVSANIGLEIGLRHQTYRDLKSRIPMKTGRRRALKITGAVALAGAGALAWRAIDQGVFSAGTGAAYDAWRTWDARPPESPLHLVHAAILAANPHNSQPWMFKVTQDAIDLYADTRRNIGTIDPNLREMYVGIGCALENLLIAAAHDGYAATVAFLPNPGNPAHAVNVRLRRANPVHSDLYAAIPNRHTNRGPYDVARPMPAELLAQLSALGADLPDVRVLWFSLAEERKRIGDLIVAASEAIVADRQQSADSAQWFRTNWQQLQKLRDGITLDAQSLPPLINAAAKILPPFDQESADKAWLRATRQHVDTAAAFGLIVVPAAHDNAMRIRGGRLWQRMHLGATNKGVAAQPLNQMSERADREQQLGIEPRFAKALNALAGDSGMQVLMPFRMGYPTVQAPASPRRELQSVLV